VKLTATLGTARLTVGMDVNFGDRIWPAPCLIDLPRVVPLDLPSVTLLGYPLTMVLANKIATAVNRDRCGVPQGRTCTFVACARADERTSAAKVPCVARAIPPCRRTSPRGVCRRTIRSRELRRSGAVRHGDRTMEPVPQRLGVNGRIKASGIRTTAATRMSP
jgi:hypothetical protein